MIYPPPWDLSGEDPSKREGNLPEAAIDTTTYPPYRLVWCLEVFDKREENLVAEIALENVDVKALRRMFRRPQSDLMIAGGWPVTGRHRRRLEALTGQKLNLPHNDYFIAASALNYSEVSPRNV